MSACVTPNDHEIQFVITVEVSNRSTPLALEIEGIERGGTESTISLPQKDRDGIDVISHRQIETTVMIEVTHCHASRVGDAARKSLC